MKVLHVINSMATGGAEKLLLDSIPLYQKFICADVLVLNGMNYPFYEQLKILNCCKIYSIQFRSVYNPFLIFKIFPFFKKYDIVHVHLFPAQYWVVIAKIVTLSRIKLIFTEHSTFNRRRKYILTKYIDQIIYSFYCKVICISSDVKFSLKKYVNLDDNKLLVINNGVDISKFVSSKAYAKKEISSDISEQDILLIQVAGFRESKDFKTLIEALLHLPDDFKLVLVGDGLLRKEYEYLVKKLNLDNRVFFLGIRTDVPELLKTVDISLLSSYWEGFGLSAVEGMASGKPFIASNVPGLADIVRNAGILFEQGNSVELAFYIEKLIRNPNYYQKVVNSCQKRAILFDIKYMVEKYMNLYESII